MVEKRKFPYPYSAMATIDSDIDSCTVPDFEEIHRFLNTKGSTKWGTGIGLDIADSMFFYNHPNSVGHDDVIRYWQVVTPHMVRDKARILKYIACGWIDTIHCIGNFTTDDSDNLCTREMSISAIDELKLQGIKITNWSNHGVGNNLQRLYDGKGDDPASAHYHTDNTIPYGVKTAIVAYSPDEGVADTLIYPLTLHDNLKLWAYKRYNNNWTPNILNLQITSDRLNTAKTNGHYIIIGNHFGANVWTESGTVTPLRLLASEYEAGNILVARITRLLNYNIVEQHIVWSYDDVGDKIVITNINDTHLGAYVPTVEDIRGITFTGATANTKIFIGENEVPQSEIDIPATGVVMVKWFAPDLTDYSQKEYVFLIRPRTVNNAKTVSVAKRNEVKTREYSISVK